MPSLAEVKGGFKVTQVVRGRAGAHTLWGQSLHQLSQMLSLQPCGHVPGLSGLPAVPSGICLPACMESSRVSYGILNNSPTVQRGPG
jgi:hypothetical protein